MRTVVGLFESGREARHAIDELRQLGFPPHAIGVITNLSTRPALDADGGGGGGLRRLHLDDVGSVAAAGPLRTALERAPEPAALRGLLRALGLSSDLAAHYASGVERGETLEAMTVDDADAERVSAVMRRHAARPPHGEGQADGRGTDERTAAAGVAAEVAGAVGRAVTSKLETEGLAGTARSGAGRVFAEEEWTIPVYREELRLGKRQVERGAVRVSTRVVERPHTEQIIVREEQVVVERRPADRLVRSEEPAFKERHIELAEMAEEVVGAKQTRLVEEVVLRKQIVERAETVGDTLRATQVDVRALEMGETRPGDSSITLSFCASLPTPSASTRWEDIELAARSLWEAKRPGTWEQFKESIRHHWSGGRG